MNITALLLDQAHSEPQVLQGRFDEYIHVQAGDTVIAGDRHYRVTARQWNFDKWKFTLVGELISRGIGVGRPNYNVRA